MDLEFDEEKEAIYIKNSFEIWQEIKKDLLKVIGNIQKNLGKKLDINSKRGYFG